VLRGRAAGQLTVMFCDLVGSTDLAGRLDPEDLRAVVRAYQETAAEVIERYEGILPNISAMDYLSTSASRWPMKTMRSVPSILGWASLRPSPCSIRSSRRTMVVHLAVRIGIHTGPVVVGEMGWRRPTRATRPG